MPDAFPELSALLWNGLLSNSVSSCNGIFLPNINKYLISLSLDYRLLKYLKMIYGYIRVSSDKQTVENQRFEINKFVEKEKMHIDGLKKLSAVQRTTTSASWGSFSSVFKKMT